MHIFQRTPRALSNWVACFVSENAVVVVVVVVVVQSPSRPLGSIVKVSGVLDDQVQNLLHTVFPDHVHGLTDIAEIVVPAVPESMIADCSVAGHIRLVLHTVQYSVFRDPQYW